MGVREASSSILHRTYATLVVSISTLLMGRASGCYSTAGAIFCDTPILPHYQLVVKILSVYNRDMGKRISVNGRRLQQLRVEQALTLRALGERSGISYDTINKLELGRRPAHASTIRKLADALGVEPKELLKGEDNG
jgi:HTH-type transcriptional regulator, competence development regulator